MQREYRPNPQIGPVGGEKNSRRRTYANARSRTENSAVFTVRRARERRAAASCGRAYVRTRRAVTAARARVHQSSTKLTRWPRDVFFAASRGWWCRWDSHRVGRAVRGSRTVVALVVHVTPSPCARAVARSRSSTEMLIAGFHLLFLFLRYLGCVVCKPGVVAAVVLSLS